MDFTWYTSIGGIVAATIVLVEVMKRFLGSTPYVSKFPTWLYAVIISGGLTLVARYVLHTLTGDTVQLVMQAVMLAAGASGFKEWISNGTKPLGASSAAINAREGKQ